MQGLGGEVLPEGAHGGGGLAVAPDGEGGGEGVLDRGAQGKEGLADVEIIEGEKLGGTLALAPDVGAVHVDESQGPGPIGSRVAEADGLAGVADQLAGAGEAGGPEVGGGQWNDDEVGREDGGELAGADAGRGVDQEEVEGQASQDGDPVVQEACGTEGGIDGVEAVVAVEKMDLGRREGPRGGEEVGRGPGLDRSGEIEEAGSAARGLEQIDVTGQGKGQVRLAVEVEDGGLQAQLGGAVAEVVAEGGLAHASLLVDDGEDPGLSHVPSESGSGRRRCRG